VGQLFASGSDALEASAKPLFDRIAAAVETQPGDVKVEGYTDSDRVKTLSFPDNIALSKARADAVAAIIKSKLTNPGRVSSQGYGDGSPIAPNTTPEGKSLNRRVEVVVPRTS
jgi:type VI secretion system protein ImpK